MATNSRAFPPDDPPTSSGFAGQLTGTNIADLIQLSCAGRAPSSFRVRTLIGQGYLCFDQGELTHAEFGLLRGEEAVFQMVALESGTFEPCPHPRPGARSIHCSWQALLLKAAQRSDEQSAPPTSRTPVVVGMSTQQDRRNVPHKPSWNTRVPAARGPVLEPIPVTPIERISHVDLVDNSIEMTVDGELIESRGKRAEQLAEIAAYVSRIAGLLGTELGLGEPAGVAATFEDESGFLLYRDAGNWHGLLGSVRELELIQNRRSKA